MPLLSLPMIALSSQAQLANDRAVTLDIVVLQIVEEVSSVTDHLLKSAAAVEILLVRLEVDGQVVDAGSQNSDLNFGRTGVGFVCAVVFDNNVLLFLSDHCRNSFHF